MIAFVRDMRPTSVHTVGLLLSIGLAACASGAEPAGALASRSRRPSAVAFSTDGAWVFVANQRAGSLTLVDPVAARVVSEHNLGRGLSDVATLPDGRRLLVVDQAEDALLLVKHSGDMVRVVAC